MKKTLSYICIVLALLSADLFSKYLVNTTISENESIPILGNFLKFTLVYNYGTTFGRQAPFMNIVIVKVLLIIILAVLFLNIAKVFKQAKHRIISKYSILLIIGGSLGNVIDRLYDKRVTDFIDIGVFGFRWYIFNVGDVFQAIGGITIMLILLWEYFQTRRHSVTL